MQRPPHEPLVPREAEHVDAERGHVQRERPGGLRRVEHIDQLMPAAKICNFRNIEHISGQIRRVRRDDKPRLRAQERLERGIIDLPAPVGRDEADGHALLALQPVKRPQHGIVLQIGRDHMVAGAKQAVQRDVQRLGDVRGEDDVVGAWAAEEGRDGLPRRKDR